MSKVHGQQLKASPPEIGEAVIAVDVGGSPALPALDGSNLTNLPAGAGSSAYSMVLGGPLDVPTLPLVGCGVEIVPSAGTLTVFKARRCKSGASGTTTIELEVNGVATGDTLSWTFSEADNTLKSATISVVVAAGDAITFRLTAAEVGAETVAAVAA